MSIRDTEINEFLDKTYLDLLDKVDFNPIFIMGAHRSGTTLLYKTLAATECFNVVKAYHIIKYDEILSNYVNKREAQAIQELEKLFQASGIGDRVIDKVIATPHLPEEYGFILKNAGYESYLNPENLSAFRQLCSKIQFISHAERPILLKNPWCFPYFMYIKEAFPEAKFVFIHRHPIHVINSKLKAARIILSTWNEYTALLSQEYQKIFKNPVKIFFFRMLYSQYFNLGLRRVTQESLKSTTYFLDNIDSLPKKNYISVQFEQLCQAPEKTILKILDFLGLEAKATLDYDKLIQPRPINLLPEVERNSQQISQQLEPYFTYHSYK